jgi:hypothetical protein
MCALQLSSDSFGLPAALSVQEESIADMRGDIEAFLQDNPEILTKANMTVGDVLHVLSLVGV